MALGTGYGYIVYSVVVHCIIMNIALGRNDYNYELIRDLRHKGPVLGGGD